MQCWLTLPFWAWPRSCASAARKPTFLQQPSTSLDCLHDFASNILASFVNAVFISGLPMRWNCRSTAAVQVPASPTRDDIQLVLRGQRGRHSRTFCVLSRERYVIHARVPSGAPIPMIESIAESPRRPQCTQPSPPCTSPRSHADNRVRKASYRTHRTPQRSREASSSTCLHSRADPSPRLFITAFAHAHGAARTVQTVADILDDA